MTDPKKQAFAVLASKLLPDMDSEVMAVGHMLEQFLSTCVADAGTGVDTGAGMECYDLWVKVNGKELFVQVSKSLGQIAKEQKGGNV